MQKVVLCTTASKANTAKLRNTTLVDPRQQLVLNLSEIQKRNISKRKVQKFTSF